MLRSEVYLIAMDVFYLYGVVEYLREAVDDAEADVEDGEQGERCPDSAFVAEGVGAAGDAVVSGDDVGHGWVYVHDVYKCGGGDDVCRYVYGCLYMLLCHGLMSVAFVVCHSMVHERVAYGVCKGIKNVDAECGGFGGKC